ncbi:hypothetical protein XO12_05800 [Marinitoga sp. 1154]|uniref:hypothetical protein n=1 Tax=Marinitoga sp. 1154 TaxID=1643335 RepID=UPI0015863F5E|nr:hypothetical protein [Marinitoga sp. 1154]NUU99631.1 hypothetical protein [Marinitoga sp. 1154]
MKLKRLPIGDSDFKTVIEDNAYYIDKSMLIKEIITGGREVGYGRADLILIPKNKTWNNI